MKKYLWILLVCLLTACSAESKFKSAEKLEKEELYLEAAKIYDSIAARNTDRSAEALFKSAEIYRKNLLFYPEAASRYKLIYELYPKSGVWADNAKISILECPDYFPLNDGNKWVEVDSQTGGSNMREERVCAVKVDPATGKKTISIRRSVYAGSKFVKDISGGAYYEKKELEVRELESPNGAYKTILKYPFEKGSAWQAVEAGRTVHFLIEDINVACKVKAGDIAGCIKIRQTYDDIGAIKYTYYAPMIGKVLTTIKGHGSDSETRNTELKSFVVKN